MRGLVGLETQIWVASVYLAIINSSHAFQLSSTSPNAVYIHIPFCRRRCHYCDFPIKVIGDGLSARKQESELYTSLLQREIKSVLSVENAKYQHIESIDTIYFGGGTPSLMPDQCKTHSSCRNMNNC